MSKIETPRSSLDFYDPTPSSVKQSDDNDDDDDLLLPFPEQHYYWDDFDDTEHNLYVVTDTGLEKWLNLKIPKARFNHFYNWSIATWGPRNLVLVISKSNRFSSDFSSINSYATIKLYDVLKKKWTEYTAVIPNIIVRKLVVVCDSLFIIGLTDNIIFDLRNNTHKRIAKLPPYKEKLDIEVETRIPLTCAHNDKVYVSNLRSIHRYNEINDEWVKVIDQHISNMVSNDDGFIYVTDVDSNTVCRFRPDVDTTMEVVGKFNDALNPIINACALGDRLIFFTNKGLRTLSIQEYSIKSDAGGDVREVWCQEGWEFKFDPYRSVCRLLLKPSVDLDFTEYHKKYIHKLEK